MALLKSLTFTTIPTPGANPTLDRRIRLIEHLEDQKRLLSDASYKRTITTWTKKNDEGVRTTVERHYRVLPWWRSAANGSFVFFVRSGWKAIEFDKGKAGIAVASLDKLPGIIDTVIAAIQSGELDEQLS